jgi:hypothetical protein
MSTGRLTRPQTDHVSQTALFLQERTKLLNKVQSEIADEIKQLRQKVRVKDCGVERQNISG